MPTDRLIALVGAPRSGTTWLQQLLASDARIVSPQETDIFTNFVAPLDAAWRHSLRGGPDAWAQRRFKGLPGVLTEDEFVAAVRAFVATTFAAAAALKPGAEVLVEKSPSHSLHGDLIARYGPPVKFVHLVRDGRDVAASLVTASAGWGSSWAPAHLRGAAQIWRDHVEGARATRDFGDYLEVRYETLRGESGADELRNVFGFCGCEIDAATAARLLEQHDRARTARAPTSIVFGGEAAKLPNAGTEPEGFAAAASTRRWPTWSVEARAAFGEEAGALLVELGYETDDRWIGTDRERRSARRRSSRRRQLGRALRRAGKTARGAGERLIERD